MRKEYTILQGKGSRKLVYLWRQEGISVKEMARRLGKHKSSVEAKKGNPIDYARNACNLFKYCYGALALYLMYNSKEIV
jgi:IS30 family transposase